MGGCATKFKVLKGDDRSVPAAPPPETKEAVAAAPGGKEGADVVAEKGESVEAVAIVNDDKVDDEATKRQSLSNLLNKNEKEGAAETETDVSPLSEPTKTEPPEPVEQESKEKKVPTVEAEPLSVEPEAAATADVAETEKKGTSAAAEDEVAK